MEQCTNVLFLVSLGTQFETPQLSIYATLRDGDVLLFVLATRGRKNTSGSK
jgi:hypothetical protein